MVHHSTNGILVDCDTNLATDSTNIFYDIETKLIYKPT